MNQFKRLEAPRFLVPTKGDPNDDTKEIAVAEILAALKIQAGERGGATTGAPKQAAGEDSEAAGPKKLTFGERLMRRESKWAMGVSAVLVLATAIYLGNAHYAKKHPTIALVSNPKSADVWLNGKNVGRSPLRIALLPGKYRVQFKLAGYEGRVETLILDKEGKIKTFQQDSN